VSVLNPRQISRIRNQDLSLNAWNRRGRPRDALQRSLSIRGKLPRGVSRIITTISNGYCAARDSYRFAGNLRA
jgi:hypothetical protein